MFKTILIANRGEIACRIMKTAQAMGIHCVAVYSTADKDSVHVTLADSAYCIGEAPARESYLNIEAIINAAKRSGAEAIHPGYGFLSENPLFAKACADAGIVFIGPSIPAIEAMASKQLAKQLLESTKVPLTPGYHGNDQDDRKLLQEAQRIGFPVLLKAAAGGGGKGMRAVDSEADFQDALASARREALSSFADEVMIIEKLVQNPRHVEVQIMADTHGNVVHLFERDCSIQRRHQKIIEEAPAPHLPDALRQKLGAAACEVARSIQYTNAGTVEFLVDSSGEFYFMEMNTRLQVEHPVTEMVTGMDLVAWQLTIAAGEKLPLAQEQITHKGHAIECRIYAEDPEHGFIPSIGIINYLKQPSGEGVRIDTGVRLNSNISRFYDPMVAKLIVWGANRDEAVTRMARALEHYHVGGIKTNIPFLKAIFANQRFRTGTISTDFLSAESIVLPEPNQELALKKAVAFDYFNTIQNQHDPILKATFSWQLAAKTHWVWRYLLQGSIREVRVEPVDDHSFKMDGSLIKGLLNQHELRTEIEGSSQVTHVQNTPAAVHCYDSDGHTVIERFNWARLDAHASTHQGQLTAPMPATVVALLKSPGDTVKAGDRLIVLEAMKMEHTIHAPIDGIIEAIFYDVGTQVNEGAELVSLK